MRAGAAAAAAAALGGALWAVAYPLSAGGVAAWVAMHAAGGAVLALLLGPVAARVCPSRATLALPATAFVLTVGLPALLAGPVMAGPARPVRAGVALALAAAAVAITLGAARLGRGALLGLVLLAVVPPFVGRAPAPGVLPAHPTLEVGSAAGAARKLAVIGIDGADWRVVESLIEAGELPNLRSLVERGATAVLRSFEPSYSPVVWGSVFSGKRPEKHGVTGWHAAHAANRGAAMLWDVAGAAGGSALVVNVPGTWPPSALHGALVSGFPMPGVVRAPARAGSEYVGAVVSREPSPGPVPTYTPESGDGEVRLELGDAVPASRLPGEHVLLEGLLRRRWLPSRTAHLRVRLPSADAHGDYEIAGRPVPLGSGEWSPWLPADALGVPVRVRARRLDDGSLYVTSPFQDSAAPAFPFTSDASVRAAVSALGMYVVEGLGWHGAEDARVRGALFEHLAQVERGHGRVAAHLLETRSDWTLFAHVITITDRVSHAYWRFHEPSADPAPDRAALARHGDRVAEAYRIADRELGRLLPLLGEDATVFVISDHGFRAEPEEGFGTHRPDGILVAAGPGVRPSRRRLRMSVLDVTPTLLALAGLPVADDMDGVVQRELVGPGAERRIASYETGDGVATRVVIDASTEEQLRGLGYVE